MFVVIQFRVSYNVQQLWEKISISDEFVRKHLPFSDEIDDSISAE